MNHPRKQSKTVLGDATFAVALQLEDRLPKLKGDSKMLTRSLLIAVLFSASSLAIAQQKSQQHATTAAPANDTCAATFTSGADHNATSYCVTVNGNIVQFSRGGDEYLRVGGFAEGYGLCDLSSNIRYFDYAVYDSGNWLASSFSATGTKAISTRSSGDGIWQIKNTITKVAATAADPGSAKVAMQVKNLTALDRNVYLFRFADIDFSRDGVDDYVNDFDSTLDTAIGLEPAGATYYTGLGLTNNTFLNVGAVALTQDTSDGPDPCGPIIAAPQPFKGDGSVIQWYLFQVPRLGTRTITLTYKPI